MIIITVIQPPANRIKILLDFLLFLGYPPPNVRLGVGIIVIKIKIIIKL